MKIISLAGFRPLFAFLFLLVFLFGCRKDFDSKSTEADSIYGITNPMPLTIENAKRTFYEKRNAVSSRSDTLNLDSTDIIIRLLTRTMPLWESAETIMYKGDIPVLAVPIAQCTGGHLTRDVFWVFFNDATGQINSRLVSISANEDYHFSETYLQYFSGNIIQFDWSGHLINSLIIENGVIKGEIHERNTAQSRTEEVICFDGVIWIWDGGCYPVPGWIEGCVTVSVESTAGNGGIGGTGTHSGGDDLGWGNGNIPNNNPSGGGSGNNISNYFNPSDFEGMARKVAVEINKFKSEYCLSLSSPDVLEALINNCNFPVEPNELFYALKENLQGGAANLSPCAKKVIIDDWFDLTSSEKDYLLAQPTVFDNISNFVKNNNCNQKAKDFADYAVSLLSTHPDYKWARLEEVYNLVNNNPNALVGNCDPHYSYWSDLASFVPSGSVLNRIQNSNGTWNVQDIQDASGARVNLDEFTVSVQSLPIINGQQLTAKQLLEHIRKNINNFAPKFTPYTDPYDKDLWNSANPLTTIFQIDMGPGVDGDVITSQYEECCWVFTTLRGPFYASGFHPVSGNRQFGYRVTNNGFEFYTKGADRATTWYHALGDSSIGFEMADAFWTGFQDKIVQYVTNNGGNAPNTFSIKNRPNWDNVKNMLKSTTPITSIPCN